jgi:putative endonuclease
MRPRADQPAAIAWPQDVRLANGRTPGRATASGGKAAAASPRRRGRHLRGMLAELAAAALLMLKGYRIVERRHRSRSGEIDLIAVRGNRLAFVEVKLRRSLDVAAASITGRQTARIVRTAEQWVWQHPRYRGHEIGFDAVLVSPGRLPLHAMNALQPHS